LVPHSLATLPLSTMFPAGSALSPNTRAFADLMVELLGHAPP
jgi:hypothetical protein